MVVLTDKNLAYPTNDLILSGLSFKYGAISFRSCISVFLSLLIGMFFSILLFVILLISLDKAVYKFGLEPKRVVISSNSTFVKLKPFSSLNKVFGPFASFMPELTK